MGATLKEIAKKLHVSVSTVSRALQDHPRIGLKTREQVKALAYQLDYQPNAIAINLKKRHTRTLGVIVPEISIHFFAQILEGMDQAASTAGYHLLISLSGENYEREKQQILNFTKANVDGILLATSKHTTDYSHFIELRKKGFPVVFFSRNHPDFPGVLSDDVGGARLATTHLIAKGCRRIAHIAGPRHLFNSKDRLHGYAEALRAHQMVYDESLIVFSNMEHANNVEAIHHILSLPILPDGIFCFNDYVAYDAIQVLKERKLVAGQDILVVGYANQPVCTYMEPSLTSVDQQAYLIGQKSVAMMLQLLDGKLPKEEFTQSLPTKLIIRSSA